MAHCYASLAKLESNVHGPGFALHSDSQAAFRKYLKHCLVVRQDLGGEFAQPGFASNGGEVTHQCRADALPLILVDDSKSHFSLPRPGDDIAGATDDFRSPTTLLEHCDQGHIVDEIDDNEVGAFVFGEVPLCVANPNAAHDSQRTGNYPTASRAGLPSVPGEANRANSGRLIAAWRVGEPIFSPRRSVT